MLLRALHVVYDCTRGSQNPADQVNGRCCLLLAEKLCYLFSIKQYIELSGHFEFNISKNIVRSLHKPSKKKKPLSYLLPST